MEKEFIKIEEDFKGIPFDVALPKLQVRLWEIANKHDTTGDKVFVEYMNWKSSSKSK